MCEELLTATTQPVGTTLNSLVGISFKHARLWTISYPFKVSFYVSFPIKSQVVYNLNAGIQTGAKSLVQIW